MRARGQANEKECVYNTIAVCTVTCVVRCTPFIREVVVDEATGNGKVRAPYLASNAVGAGLLQDVKVK